MFTAIIGAVAVAALLTFGHGSTAPAPKPCSLSENTIDYTTHPPAMIYDKCPLPELDGWGPWSDQIGDTKADDAQ